jgi:hypothetical protein
MKKRKEPSLLTGTSFYPWPVSFDMCQVLAAFVAAGPVSVDPSDPKHFSLDQAELKRLVPPTRPGSSMGFQIASLDALPCSLWFAARYGASFPAQALFRAVGAGGDTDTVASMCGAVVGALHGMPPTMLEGAERGEAGWLPASLVAGLENDHARGRAFAVACAERLAALDLREAASVREMIGGASLCSTA